MHKCACVPLLMEDDMNQNIRARQFMYVQQLRLLKIPLEELPEFLRSLNTTEWAYIVHDKDKHQDGSLVEPHIHIVLKYLHPQTLVNIAKKFEDKPEYLEVWIGRIDNAYSYLLHRTDNAKGKFPYSPSEVVASFDFEQRIQNIEKHISKKEKKLNSEAIQSIIDEYAQSETLDHTNLIKQIGITEFAKRTNLIDNIDRVKLDQKHQKFLAEFEGPMITYWLYGPAGAGKTTIAKLLSDPTNTAILGSSRDYFQTYKGENCVIINDLRPDKFSYSDLLKLLDTTENDKMAPRRYHDIPLNLKIVFITTPYSPEDFYNQTYIQDRKIDTFAQLNRRIKAIYITKEFLLFIQEAINKGYKEIILNAFKYDPIVNIRSICERIEEIEKNLPF